MPPDERAVPAPGVEGSSRSLPSVLLWLTVALLLARVITGYWESRHPPRVVSLVEWQPIESAVAKSRQQGRAILYDFTAEWCPPCKVMEREIFADREAAATISGLFIPVRVVDRMREDGRNPPAVAALQSQYKVEAFPTLVIVNPDGGEPITILGYPGRARLTKQLTDAGMKARMRFRFGGLKPDSAPVRGR